MLTVTPAQLATYGDRMLNPMRDLIDRIQSAETPVVKDQKVIGVSIHELNTLVNHYKDIGALLAILQGYVGREADYQSTLRVLGEEMHRISEFVPEEKLAELEVETQQAFEAFHERIGVWKEHILNVRNEADSHPEIP